MKKLTIILGAIACLSVGCSQNNTPTPNNNNNTNNTSTSDLNTITITDNGTSYTVKGTWPRPTTNDNGVDVEVVKGTQYSAMLVAMVGTGFDFNLNFSGLTGPTTGVGTFTGSGDNILTGSYTEGFSGGQNYSIDSINMNVTTCSSSKVEATFTMWLENTGGNKTVTGTINANKPIVQ